MKRLKMDNKSKNSKKDCGSSPRPSGSGRIVTMDSIRNAQQDERQAYFAGGSEHSGQQILGRGKRRNDQDPSDISQSGEALAAAFRRAAASSGIEPSRMVSYYPEPQMFTGVGHRLGDTESAESEVVPGIAVENLDEDAPTHVVVTLWENGFNVDDGPLHSYDDPECANLMENIDRGELPTNIIPTDRNPVHMSVVDKRKQKFKESVKVFGGKGHILGSPTPPISSAPDSNPEQNAGSPESTGSRDSSNGSSNGDSFRNLNDSLVLMRKRLDHASNFDEDYTPEDIIFEDDEESNSSGGFEYPDDVGESSRVFGGHGHVLESTSAQPGNLNMVNGSSRVTNNIHVSFQPGTSREYQIDSNTDFSDSGSTTMLKIRLPDGQTVQITVNSSSTISQIKEFIQKCIPALQNTNFVLLLTYPRRELRDEESVDSGEINNSVLVLRI